MFDEDKQDDCPSVAMKSSTDQGTAKASDSNEVRIHSHILAIQVVTLKLQAQATKSSETLSEGWVSNAAAAPAESAFVEQKITIMSLVKVALSPGSEPMKYHVSFSIVVHATFNDTHFRQHLFLHQRIHL